MKSDQSEIIAALMLDKHRLERELRTDDITGLGNLRALKECLNERRELSFGVLFIDIDFFKLVNEEHGHMAATGVLRDFGAMLGTLASARGDRAFRYAGDEFVVILDRDAGEAAERAETLRRLVEHRIFRVEGHGGKVGVRITVSIGCRVRSLGEPVEQILSDADKALFEAKRKSRNVAVSYSA